MRIRSSKAGFNVALVLAGAGTLIGVAVLVFGSDHDPMVAIAGGLLFAVTLTWKDLAVTRTRFAETAREAAILLRQADRGLTEIHRNGDLEALPGVQGRIAKVLGMIE
ncbi:MAG: hypothetical protein F4X00_15630 [Gemmatimonadetes bacterium]|nr:hypothetical protein [Gemmatimonadota bacterium]